MIQQLEHPGQRADIYSAAHPSAYADYVNPEWVRLLYLLGMNVRYRRCSGTELHAEDGRIFLDFLSGYYVHNTGHNGLDMMVNEAFWANAAGPGRRALRVYKPRCQSVLESVSEFKSSNSAVVSRD
jgi:acetylornithine/succinyldiaminopimelate/putrescine aminotransferase